MTRRYILTGTPGAGKTSILRSLARSGYTVVEEAATEVIARGQARGVDEPWNTASFVDDVVALQRRRQLGRVADPGADPDGIGAVELYDRSPVCTLALSDYLARPVGPPLAAEIDRITRDRVYQRQVFFVRNLGFCEPTPARRISFEESLLFEQVHERTYRSLGYDLIEVPAGDLGTRAAAVRAAIARLAGG
jgi:predicted ATPase